jgi:hypothetical protein|tara:strand:- start:1470 stop:1820 length:351 start_codon:yes stop_codon:yes gene_type:complete
MANQSPDNKDDHVYRVIEKLDTAIIKLVDLSSDIKTILAVHETRIDQTNDIVDRQHVAIDAVHVRIGTLRDDCAKAEADIRDELSRIQQWKWMILGGAAVISSLISMGVHLPGVSQ